MAMAPSRSSAWRLISRTATAHRTSRGLRCRCRSKNPRNDAVWPARSADRSASASQSRSRRRLSASIQRDTAAPAFSASAARASSWKRSACSSRLQLLGLAPRQGHRVERGVLLEGEAREEVDRAEALGVAQVPAEERVDGAAGLGHVLGVEGFPREPLEESLAMPRRGPGDRLLQEAPFVGAPSLSGEEGEVILQHAEAPGVARRKASPRGVGPWRVLASLQEGRPLGLRVHARRALGQPLDPRGQGDPEGVGFLAAIVVQKVARPLRLAGDPVLLGRGQGRSAGKGEALEPDPPVAPRPGLQERLRPALGGVDELGRGGRGDHGLGPCEENVTDPGRPRLVAAPASHRASSRARRVRSGRSACPSSRSSRRRPTEGRARGE